MFRILDWWFIRYTYKRSVFSRTIRLDGFELFEYCFFSNSVRSPGYETVNPYTLLGGSHRHLRRVLPRAMKVIKKIAADRRLIRSSPETDRLKGRTAPGWKIRRACPPKNYYPPEDPTVLVAAVIWAHTGRIPLTPHVYRPWSRQRPAAKTLAPGQACHPTLWLRRQKPKYSVHATLVHVFRRRNQRNVWKTRWGNTETSLFIEILNGQSPVT